MRRKTAATSTMAAREIRKKIAMEYPQLRQCSNRAWGKYRVDGTDREESAEKTSKWSGEELEGLVTEDADETAGGAGGVDQMLVAMARGLEGSGAESAPGGAEDGRGNTWGVTSKDADEVGAGSHHGEKQSGRERVSGRRVKPDGESSGVGSREGAPEASGVAENPGGGLPGSGRGSQVDKGHRPHQSGIVAP